MIFKRLHYVILLMAGGFLLQSCENEITLTLPIEVPSQEITIPPIDTTGMFEVGPIMIDINFDSIAAANDVKKSSITSIKVSSVTYTMVTPVDANFNIFESLANYASAADLPEIRYAKIDTIPKTGLNQIVLLTEDVELRDYLLSNSFGLIIKGRNESKISMPVKIRLDMAFKAKAKVLE